MQPLRIFWTWFVAWILQDFHVQAYRKYYVEDECISPSDFQKVYFRLPQTGPDSVGELRSNRFGTYSRTGRNCLIKLLPPEGHGVVVTVLRVDFRNHEGCKDYIKIFDDDDDGERLCGLQEIGLDGKNYFSDSEIKILYHTAAGGMGFSNGFRLIFTVTKLEDGSSCSAPDEFKCSNLNCIWAGVTCDGINNCGDGSDENSTEYPHCSEITPIAIVAVVLGVISFIGILVLTCLCCCQPQSSVSHKKAMVQNVRLGFNAGYALIPGYEFDTVDRCVPYQQPIHSPMVHASAPVDYLPGCSENARISFITSHKDNFRYSRPPPPYMER